MRGLLLLLLLLLLHLVGFWNYIDTAVLLFLFFSTFVNVVVTLKLRARRLWHSLAVDGSGRRNGAVPGTGEATWSVAAEAGRAHEAGSGGSCPRATRPFSGGESRRCRDEEGLGGRGDNCVFGRFGYGFMCGLKGLVRDREYRRQASSNRYRSRGRHELQCRSEIRIAKQILQLIWRKDLLLRRLAKAKAGGERVALVGQSLAAPLLGVTRSR